MQCAERGEVIARAREVFDGLPEGAVVHSFAVEPVYDHNGYYDPSGGTFTLEGYEAFKVDFAKKIGKLPSLFTECPTCGTAYTIPVPRCCRGCGYRS